VTIDLDRAGPAFNHSRAMIDVLDDDPAWPSLSERLAK
jgi:hypothetical protein